MSIKPTLPTLPPLKITAHDLEGQSEDSKDSPKPRSPGSKYATSNTETDPKEKKKGLWSRKKKKGKHIDDLASVPKSFSSEKDESSTTTDNFSDLSEAEKVRTKEKKKHFWSKKSKTVKDQATLETQDKDSQVESPKGLYIPPSDTEGSIVPSSPVESSLKHTQSDAEYPEMSASVSPKDSKSKFWKKLQKKKKLSVEIGAPFNIVHQSHVDFEYNWTMHDPNKTFELLDLLGTGTFGSVYKARHRESGFILAVKLIKTKDAAEFEEVIKEVEILRKLKHPNTVSYYGCCAVNKKELWIMIEYCDVGSARDFLELWPEALSEQQIATILSHTLQGLVYLHDNRIAHRDIKAANVLLNSSGQSKLADFGVAGQLSKSLGKLNDFVGTVLFMDPEIFQERAGYDLSADIWSLGIMSIELAERGEVPYCNDRVMTAMQKIASNPPPTLTDTMKWSPKFRDFVGLCLQKDPSRRPKARMLLKHPFILSHRSDILRECILSDDESQKTPTLPRVPSKSPRRAQKNSGQFIAMLPTTAEITPQTSTLSTPLLPPDEPRAPKKKGCCTIL